jgi:hypothetical protein
MRRPWFTEDNKVDFIAEGFSCCMRRGPIGAWCGYVGIPKEHPWYGKSYRDSIKPTKDMLGPRDALDHGPIDVLCMAFSGKKPEEELDICLALRVHGGITYASDHEPMGKPDGLWWFGFDCAHSGDLVPGMLEYGRFEGDVYRDQSYVVAECQSLAAQLAKVMADAEA